MIKVDLVVVVELDTKALDEAIAAGTFKNLGHFGGYVRKVAQRSLRYRTEPSIAGQPPSAHRSSKFTIEKTTKKLGTHRQESSLLRELISYAVIGSKEGSFGSVVIGPKVFSAEGIGGGRVPPTLEMGGPAVAMEAIPLVKAKKASKRQAETFKRLVKEGRIIVKSRRAYRPMPYRMAPRPFMGPAFRTSLNKYTKTLGGGGGI